MSTARLLLLAGLMLGASAMAQPRRAPGTWRSYLSHTLCRGVTERGGIAYTITTGGLYTYNPSSGEVRTYSTEDGLSGIEPTAIHRDLQTGRIFIGYADGMIDQFDELDDIGYYSDIQRNTFFADKRVNDFASQDSRLYVATNFGLVVYDTQAGLPLTDVSQFGNAASRLPVRSVAIADGRIWIVSANLVYSASRTAPNLKDPAAWQLEGPLQGVPEGRRLYEVAAAGGMLYARGDSGIFRREAGVWQRFTPFDGRWDRLFSSGTDGLGVIRLDRVYLRTGEGRFFDMYLPNTVADAAILENERFAIALDFFGMWEVRPGILTSILPPGPANNECNRLAVGNGELYIAPGGYDGAFAPTLSAQGVYYHRLGDTAWTWLTGANAGLPPAVATGFARARYDQANSTAYLGSWGSGIVQLQAGAASDHYHCANSGITTIAQPCDTNNRLNSRVSGMDFDAQGNLWVSLDFAFEPLVMRNPAGEWVRVPAFKFPQNDHIVDLLVDDFGNKWMINSEQGLLVYTENGTPDVWDDGRVLALRTGVNQGDLPNNEVLALAKDRDGFVWVGTSTGVTVFYDLASISLGNIVDASEPVYNRTALLKNTVVTCIAVDGGNRKWIGTENGVFLVSEAGDEVLFQFTEENSPLLSNVINDIQIDPGSGEVFIATSRGLISYQGDATAPAEACEGLFVYPNPVFSDYEGQIMIQGTGFASAVRITTVSGLLVREVEAQGGTAVWDGLDVYGRKVRSGLYLALAAGPNGENPCLGKFVIINR
ncbi:MAG: two-component regulator propeller domain-containing protein [Bacteroidia bacterium]|nr:two-component regulator propeller domain-containing protein [Bacteroidia bacterium]